MLDLEGVTFRDFIGKPSPDGQPGNYSFVLRGYVRRWCQDLDGQIETIPADPEPVDARSPAGGGRRRVVHEPHGPAPIAGPRQSRMCA